MGISEADRTILRAIGLPRRVRLAVAAELGMSSPAMHQRAAHLIDDPEVERAMPVEVHRLRRVRDDLRRRRTL